MNDVDVFQRYLSCALDQRRQEQLLRRRLLVQRVDATHVRIDGRVLIDFSSNDYLGLSHHPRVLEALGGDCRQVGAKASGLVSGHSPDHASAERAIAAWKGCEASILLPSGYQANLAAVQTIAAVSEKSGTKTRFLIDKLAHASLIDAVRASGCDFRVFPHNHLDKLRRLLEHADDAVQVVVTESIFSMDGDSADLSGLARLKQSHRFVLLLDEAHAGGVYGPYGSGYAAEQGLSNLVDVGVVTLSKALGCSGGAICGSRALIDAVVNFGRACIYSTALSLPIAKAVERAVSVLRDEPWRQVRLRQSAVRVRQVLRSAGLVEDTKGQPGILEDSPIIPVILKTESAALSASERLAETGLFVVAIRPPTVPRGTSRLRITLSCEHTNDQLDHLLDRLVRVCQA